jgi:hypothetical protein
VEVFAVITMKSWVGLALAAALELSAFTPAALAQKTPDANAKPAAKAKAPSPCKGLDEAACGKMGKYLLTDRCHHAQGWQLSKSLLP